MADKVRILIPTDSSFIDRMKYNYSDSTLTVKFRSGKIWKYYNIEESLFEELTTSDSVGATFNTKIRNR